MQDPDIMLFCVPCRKQVEKNIETDQKIEEKCQEITRNYEGRIKALEDKIENKVSNEEVRQIVQEIVTEKNDQELRKIAREVFEDGIKGNQEVKQIAKEIVSNTIEDTKNEIAEMTEQRDRDRNFIVYGLEEPAMDSRENRAEAEKREVIEIARRCHVKVDPFNITKIHRLGTYEPKKNRPLLVAIDDIEKKRNLYTETSTWSDSQFLKASQTLIIKKIHPAQTMTIRKIHPTQTLTKARTSLGRIIMEWVSAITWLPPKEKNSKS